MLLPEDIHPENSIYYNGAFVLQVLQKRKTQHLLHLYQTVKKQRNMTFPVFVLCLDWLFLIDAAVLNDKSEVELCS
jgi:hypothetical protein